MTPLFFLPFLSARNCNFSALEFKDAMCFNRFAETTTREYGTMGVFGLIILSCYTSLPCVVSATHGLPTGVTFFNLSKGYVETSR